jgi:large subunit ribosomal protein L29
MKENAERARALDTNEIEKQMRESNEQMFRLRFQMRMGQMEGLKKYRSLRRERARMLTVLREREMHPEAAAPVPAPKHKATKKPAAKAAEKPKAAAKPKAEAKAPHAVKAHAAAKSEKVPVHKTVVKPKKTAGARKPAGKG